MARYGDLGTQYFDDAGDPLVNGKVYFYETGTTTLKATYADVDYTIANTNPVILTAAGRQPNIFFEGVAKAILATSAGTQILVRDPVGDTAESFGNPWISSKRYSANDVVQGSDGQYYVSLINGNVNLNPVTTTGNWTFLYSVEWNAGTTYKEGSVITYQSLVYQSLQNTNLNKNPLTETTFWTAIQLSWISTVTYALNANVVASNGVLYTSIQAANTNNAPATSPLWWVGTSAAAAASASAALASQVAAAASAVAAAASASTATTQASNAATSASTATTQASNASGSAVAAAASALAASSSATASSNSAAASLASQLAAAASAAAALASENAAELAEANATGIVYGGGYSTTPVASNVPIADTSGTLENWVNPSINKRTTALARAVQVSITAATSASNGIQQLTNVQNNFGTSNFALQWRGSVPDWTPAADVILINKHDGANGYILTLLTTGILRTTINGTNYDSTVATGMADGYVAVIDVDITRSSASAAGSIVYTLNGVILGASVAITATGDTTTELLTNGDFATDTVWTKGTGWTIAAGVASFTATGSSAGLSQPIAFVAGRVYTVTVTLTRVAGSVQLMRFEGGTAVGTTTVSASGTYTQYLTAVTGNVTFVINAGSTFTGTVDNVSLKSILLTVDNTSSLYVCGTSAVRSAAQWFSHRLFNRAKTVAENLGMFVNGMASADVGASQTATYTSAFATADGFAAISGSTTTVNANVDGVSDGTTSKDDCLQMVKLAVAGTGTGAAKTSGTLFTDLKNAWLQASVYVPSGQTYIDGFLITRGSTISAETTIFDGTGRNGTWVNLSGLARYVSTASVNTRLYFWALDGSNTVISASAVGEMFYINGVSFGTAGITSELLAQNAQTDNGQVLDSSGNKQHAKLAIAGMSTQGAISARRREVRWTNTWAGTNELQYIGGVNQAILPSNAYIESIVGTVSGATPQDIIVGDGSSTNRYVTITTALAAGTNTFTVANRTTDATNLKLTVTPDTAATMSIAWVITYYRLES